MKRLNKSTDKASFERAKRDIANCDTNKQLLGTFTVDQMLWKLSSDDIKVYSCHSPIDRRHLPYYERYLKPSVSHKLIVIPFCDGVHFVVFS